MLDGTTRLKDAKGNKVLHGNFVSGFSDHTVVPEGGLVPINKDVPLDWACLMSCCIPTGWSSVTKIANVMPGDKVAVWGLGGVGQNILRAAKMRQANPLIAIDLEEARRAVAMELGATHFICSSKEDPVPIIKELTGGGAGLRLRGLRRPGRHRAGGVDAGHGRQAHGHRHHGPGRGGEDAAHLHGPAAEIDHGGLYGRSAVQDDIPKLCDLAMTGEMKIDKIIEGKFKLDQINDIAEKMEAAPARRPLGLRVGLTGTY